MNRNNRNTIETNDPYFDEIKAKTSISFDFVLWFYRILKYWYLFVLSILICLGIAYLENKSWVAVYTTQALIMLEDRGNTGVVNAVPMGNLLRNTTNQQILLASFGMTERAVKNLPQKMRVDYFRQTHFKRFSIYTVTPIRIDIIDLPEDAYAHTFNVAPVDDKYCRIYYEEDEDNEIPEFSVVVPYNKEVTNPKFTIKLEKTSSYTADFEPFSFRFLSDGQLIGMYSNRIIPVLKDDSGTALEIFMSGTDPYRDIDYLTTLLEEFQGYNLFLKNQQADLTINFIERQLGIINDSLQSSRAALDKFQKETGVYEITSQGLRLEIDQADEEKEKLALKERATLIVTQKIGESILGNTELINPTVVGLEESKLTSLITEYNDLLARSRYLGAKNPLYNKTIDSLNGLRTQILSELQLIQSRLQNSKDGLVKKYQLLDLKVYNLPPQERDLIKFEREFKVNEMYFQFLTQKRYEAQIQKASNTPDNFIWEMPRIFSGPNNGGDIQKNYMFFFFIGILLPLIFIVLKEEIFNYTISTKEECEKISGLPVIGTIENISKKLKTGVVLVKNYPKSSFAESFRNMRVRLEYMAKRESNITVLVTSSEPGDGKTFIATNIASVYQLMRKKVIVVDLDLRRPSIAKTLQLDSHKGVSNYLIGQVELEDLILSPPEYGFDIIPAGTLPPNPSELIKTEKTKELIEYLKTKYDYVIIDCSPVGLVSDAYVLARMVDTTLFAVRRGKTNKSFFKSVINQLKFDGIENVALVFNDVKGREGYYGTSRYYGDKTYYLKKNSYYHDDYFEN
ncbi:exopolysaccharide transport family protein [Dysgonomonas sp. ZJ279]|uniref:exopolysaccharide transport family protein n=1 Tax=Dysgonomonas sp. ZJ279 TaxID=2709796 RepID=UPI0013ECC05D|nr:polysaccharide biosynthesis tyrosine autokinase [Dysgonomonas sp. ZJ279]